MDSAAFGLYTRLKKITEDYKLEDKLQIPQLVIVGETSVGKSMLVQHFLRFPCSFSQAKIATRCPVAYRLHHNRELNDGEIKVRKPVGVTPQELAKHLANYMREIEESDGFRLEPYTVELESNAYSDFEILDIPGLVGGDRDEQHRNAVERITEEYVRNQNFMIVQLREAHQPLANANGMRTIHELCTATPAKYNHCLPPRDDYLDHTVTIQTKFNIFMSENINGKDVNELIDGMKSRYANKTYFTNMIFDGYVMTDHSYDDNVKYIADLPKLEEKKVDEWIAELNQAAIEQPDNAERFNDQNRPLIGIDIVRTKIQALWIQAIRAAIPHLKAAIGEQLTDAQQRYELALEKLKQQNPETVREQYTQYINSFHNVLTQYINAKSETDIAFKYSKCSKTYYNIEMEYEQWPRRIPHTWRAYLSYKDMKQLFTNTNEYGRMLDVLDRELAGARHFHRLEQVFKAMIYTFKPRDLTRGEIETVESHIAHSISTGENLEKAIRELVRSLIRETFLIGICWLTQMYTFLCDMFQNDVTKYLLFTTNQYPQLQSHFRFIHCVELSYHKMVRTGIQKSLQLIKLTRDALTSYVTHDLTAVIKKLAYSIPAEINHKEFNQSNGGIRVTNNEEDTQRSMQTTSTNIFEHIPPIKIRNHLFSSESYLTPDRNPETANHHDHGRRVVLEMYSAVRGQLINMIIAAFNTNLVVKLHEFNMIRPDMHSLQGRLMAMSLQKIARMADVKHEEIQKELDNTEVEIIALENVLSYIDELNNPSNSARHAPATTTDYQQRNSYEENNAKKQQFRRNRKNIEKQMAKSKVTEGHGNDNDGSDNEEIEDYESYLIKSRNKIEANCILTNIYKKEDNQDMEAAFLEGDSLDADEYEPRVQQHLSIVADRISYDTVVLPEASLPHSLPPQSETRALQSFSRSSASIEATSLSSDQNQNPLTNQTIASLSSQPDAQHQRL
ncbi:unnamed protein product [Adineta steineri]|uniref:Dynamin N-terminal domain-containing protein n=1 Tax=Adineta steineri TaxID=433720 RepID=A0A814CE45_9BILA|nr:unnamed protein product [Adineta steineri]CAF3911970.1 unnamed protein product [Adineta steineri]